MNKERCNELYVSFVRGLGSVVSEKCEKATNIEILMKAASVVAIAVWLRSPLTEVAIQFDGRNGQRNWIEDCFSFCLLDLLDFIAGFASTREKWLWFDRE